GSDATFTVLAHAAHLQRDFDDPHALAEQVNEAFLRIGETAEQRHSISRFTVERAKAAGNVCEARPAAHPIDDAGDHAVAVIFHYGHLRSKLWIGKARAGDKIRAVLQQWNHQRLDVGRVELHVAVDVDDDVGAAAHGA